MKKLLETLTRWRTWLANVLFVVILSPDLLNALVGFNWGTIVPPKYLPYILLAQAVLNVWMRPRPAALASDPEVKVKQALDRTEGRAHVEVKADGVTKAVIHG